MNMDNVFRVPSGAPYFEDESSILLCADTFRTLSKLKESSVDMIFADPPYFLSNDGITCQAGKMVSVNKAEWDKGKTAVDRHHFNSHWLAQCYKVLKPNGTIWVSGTLHSIYSVGMALEQEGYRVLNNITWQKTNPPPNLACRCFTHSTETILWAKKNCRGNRHVFNYVAMAAGHHPTQKPEYLLERIILASTQPGSIVLDPFCGSGTTGVAAKRLGRYFIGIDNVSQYIEISRERMGQIQWPETSMRG
jgi:site-specific DNA-methyltransferase (adenine-specific)